MNHIDTSVLVAAMVAGEAYHKEGRSLILKETVGMYGHGLTETFSTLTGGRKAFRLAPSVALASHRLCIRRKFMTSQRKPAGNHICKMYWHTKRRGRGNETIIAPSPSGLRVPGLVTSPSTLSM
jgi:hypothetical protein